MRNSVRHGLSAALMLLMATAAAPALAQHAEAPSVRRDAREQAPAALLGVWEVVGGAPNTKFLRSFSYTAEGKVLVHFLSVNAKGEQTQGHWVAQLDGSQALEYHSRAGATPYADIRLTKVDDQNFNLTNTVNGTLRARSAWRLTPDGQTLTMTRTPVGGATSTTTYKRWTGQ